MQKFYDISDSIDTVDSFIGQILLKRDSIIIPYINLGIVQHALNYSSKLKFINFSYIYGFGLKLLKANNQIISNGLEGTYQEKNSIFLGGSSLVDSQKQIHELELQASEVFLFLPHTYKIRSNFWIPVNTPNFKRNMDEREVDDFIFNKHIPIHLGDWNKSTELK